MPKLTKRDLRIYVLGAQVAKDGHDPIAALIPFFEPAMKKFEGQLFSSERFIQELKKIGILFNLTTDVIDGLVPLFVRHGWLKKEKVGKNRSAFYVSKKIGNEVADLGFKADSIMDKLGNHFKEFVDRLNPLLYRNQTQKDLEELLLNWLVSVDGTNKEEIATRVTDALKNKETDDEVLDAQNILTIKPEEVYLCARFVKELSKTDDELFSELSDITSVALLTDVLLDFHYPKKPKNVDLKLVLDAPYLLSVVGVSGEGKKDNAQFLIDMAKKLDCKLSTFDHCIQEAQDNLKAVLALPMSDRFGPTGDALRVGEIDEHFVKSIRANLEAVCRQKGISIIPQTLDQFPSQHKFFSKENYENFFSKIRWHHDAVYPRERDATSMTLVMRRRQGHQTNDLLMAKYVMLSDNPIFAEVAQQYCQQKGILKATRIAPVMHQSQIATILWLCSGGKGNREISRKQLLSTCATALKTSKEMFEKAREEFKEWDSPEKREQLGPLLANPRSVLVLMDKTLGNPQIIEDNIPEIFEAMRRSTAEDIQKEADEKTAELTEKIAELTEKFRVSTEETKLQTEKQEKQDELMLKGWVGIARDFGDTFIKKIKHVSIFVVFITILSFIASFIFDLLAFSILTATITMVTGIMSVLLNLTHIFDPYIKGYIDKKKRKIVKDLADKTGRGDLLKIFEIDWDNNTISRKKTSSSKSDSLSIKRGK